MADGFSLAALHVGLKFRGVSVRCLGLFHQWQGVDYPELLFPASVVDSLSTMWLCRCFAVFCMLLKSVVSGLKV